MRELEIARYILSTPRDASIKIGAGFMGWMLDMGGHPVDTLDVALEQRVESIWLSFGDDLGKWVDYIRKYDQSRTTTHKTLIWIVVNSVAEAEVADHKWKVDVLVVQGRLAQGSIVLFLNRVALIQGLKLVATVTVKPCL
jgi:nitronate monooxygenase